MDAEKDVEIACLKAELAWVKETLQISIELNKTLDAKNAVLKSRLDNKVTPIKMDYNPYLLAVIVVLIGIILF